MTDNSLVVPKEVMEESHKLYVSLETSRPDFLTLCLYQMVSKRTLKKAFFQKGNMWIFYCSGRLTLFLSAIFLAL